MHPELRNSTSTPSRPITPHTPHQCIDRVHQHLRAANHTGNHRVGTLQTTYEAYIRQHHMTVKAAIRYVCEWPKKCAARAQGDGSVRWIDVVGRQVRVRMRARRYRYVTRIYPR